MTPTQVVNLIVAKVGVWSPSNQPFILEMATELEMASANFRPYSYIAGYNPLFNTVLWVTDASEQDPDDNSNWIPVFKMATVKEANYIIKEFMFDLPVNLTNITMLGLEKSAKEESEE